MRRLLLEALGCYTDAHHVDVFGYVQEPHAEQTELVVLVHGTYHRLTIEHITPITGDIIPL